MKVNGIELNFSLFNPDHILKYREAERLIAEKYGEAEDKYTKDVEGFAQSLRDACNVIFDFFDTAFGEDTSNKVFGSETDLEKCVDAFSEIGTEMQAQAGRFSEKLARFHPQK